MNLINIEKEFDNFIGTVGGKRVDEIVGSSPDFYNADYLFEGDRIVAELKCLRDNKLNDKNLNKSILKVCKKWESKGYRIDCSNDGWRGKVSNLPQGCSREILNIYAKSIKKRILKANKQIKNTKEELGLEDYKGLLLLANDGNLSIDPEHMYHIISRSMMNSCSGINAVIYFTVNYPCAAEFTNVDTLVWANFNRPKLDPIENEFFNRLQKGWSDHFSSLLGSDIPSIRLESENDLSLLTNVSHDITNC